MRRVLLVLAVLAIPAIGRAETAVSVGYNGVIFQSTQFSWQGSGIFRLFDQPEAGTQVWPVAGEETPVAVEVDGGYYHVDLPIPAEVLQGGDLFLEVELQDTAFGAGPLKPRMPFSWVPRAVVCKQADTVPGMDAILQRLEALEKGLRPCPSDMVPVGDFCVDKYESSIWARNNGQPVVCSALQAAVTEAIAAWGNQAGFEEWMYNPATNNPLCAGTEKIEMCDYRQYGSPPSCETDLECDDYSEDFPDSGNRIQVLYGCSIRGVMPSRSMTWFQAQQACTASGKHLITNSEWQASVAGTPDPGVNNGWHNARCNTAGDGPRSTGSIVVASEDDCVSAYGVQDAIGNLSEWVDLWGQAGFTWMETSSSSSDSHPWTVRFAEGKDSTRGINGQAKRDATGWNNGLPFAAIRGGYWADADGAGAFHLVSEEGPNSWRSGLGFRCGRAR